MVAKKAFVLALLLPSVAMSASETPLIDALEGVRAERRDLAIRPERWDTQFRLATVGALLRDPLSIPQTAADQERLLSEATQSSMYVELAAQWLSLPLNKAPLPPSSGDPIVDLEQAIRRAQALLNQSVDSVRPEDRATILAGWKAILSNHEETTPLEHIVPLSASFDQGPLFQAAYDLMRTIDRAIPFLQKSSRAVDQNGLVIRYGRHHTYKESVAAAGEKQIRIVIDFAENITIDSQSDGAAGSGAFGIGLLYCPNASGVKTLHTGYFSQGSGVFGVGGFFVQSSSGTFVAESGSQGASAFGLGMFTSRAAGPSLYQARFAAQGFGTTRGVGVFIHRGDGAQISGGLVETDSRDALAFSSLCQGVGYGPRAFAAGGIGLALVQGNHNRIESSYFSQGAGYWHGFGGFYLLGNENHLQGRRYTHGAGIHTAAGSLLIRGDRNNLETWGVGPAYGWDLWRVMRQVMAWFPSRVTPMS